MQSERPESVSRAIEGIVKKAPTSKHPSVCTFDYSGSVAVDL